MTDRIAIYTCIVGAYDELHQPRVLEEGFDFICFVAPGEKTAPSDGVWQIRELPEAQAGATLSARWAKTHPHVLLPDYSCSVWIDGNIALLDGSLYHAARCKAGSDSQFSGVPHPDRDCTYQEARKCLDMKYLTLFGWLRVLCWLRCRALPRHAGLIESNLVFRRHTDPAVAAFDESWWERILHLSRRDQLSLIPLLRQSGLTWDDRLLDGKNTRNHPGFRYLLHK